MTSHPRRIGLLWLCLAFACSAQRGGGPEDAYWAFARAAQKGDAAGAWSALSSRTQAEIERRVKALAEASGGAVKNDPAALLFSSPDVQRGEKIGGVEVVSMDGGTAIIRVTVGQRGRELRMVKEQAAWKLDLADTL